MAMTGFLPGRVCTDTGMVEKHYDHPASSCIVDTIPAVAPNFGFTPDASVVPLRG